MRTIRAAFTALLLIAGAVALAAPAQAGPPITTPVGSHCYYTICFYQTTPGGNVVEASSLFDVGPTPYYRSIWDKTTGTRIALCGTGTACTSAPIYLGYNVCHEYIAYQGGSGATMPPAPVQYTSTTVWVCGPRLG
jgi:hypothetical protein